MPAHDDLRRLAEQATPGEWYAYCPQTRWRIMSRLPDGSDVFVLEGAVRSHDVRRQDDAAFIAACSPERIQALVEENRRLREALSESYDCYHAGTEGACPKVGVPHE